MAGLCEKDAEDRGTYVAEEKNAETTCEGDICLVGKEPGVVVMGRLKGLKERRLAAVSRTSTHCSKPSVRLSPGSVKPDEKWPARPERVGRRTHCWATGGGAGEWGAVASTAAHDAARGGRLPVAAARAMRLSARATLFSTATRAARASFAAEAAARAAAFAASCSALAAFAAAVAAAFAALFTARTAGQGGAAAAAASVGLCRAGPTGLTRGGRVRTLLALVVVRVVLGLLRHARARPFLTPVASARGGRAW